MHRYFNAHPGFWYSCLIHLAIFSALFLFSARSILNTPIYRQIAEIHLENTPSKKEAAPTPMDKVRPLASASQQFPQVQLKLASREQYFKKENAPISVTPETKLPSKEADAMSQKTEPIKETREGGAEGPQAAQAAQTNIAEAPRSNVVAMSDQAQPVTKATSDNADTAGAWGAYGKNLSQACVKFRRYPASAVASGMRGTVYVTVRVHADGTSEIAIKKSSGFKMLDDEALSMVGQASKVVAIPDILKSKTRELVIPIGFEL